MTYSIIGILAAIALPQYNRAVEKGHLSEALVNINNFQKCAALLRAEGGITDQGGVPLPETGCPIEFSGEGTWSSDKHKYTTKHFLYVLPICFASGCGIEVQAFGDNKLPPTSSFPSYVLYWDNFDGAGEKTCVTEETEMGRYICKYLKSQGFEYLDEVW